MSQLVLGFVPKTPAKNPLYIDDWRRRIAAGLDAGPASKLFWYQENGSTRTDAPRIRWVKPAPGTLGLLSCSEDCHGLVSEYADKVAGFLDSNGLPVETHIFELHPSISASRTVNRYRVRFAVFTKAKGYNRFQELGDVEKNQFLVDFITRSLIEECELLGLDDAPVREGRPFVEVVSDMAVPVKANTRHYAYTVRANVYMPVSLTGLWQIGKLRNRGMGLIIPQGGILWNS